MFWRRRLPVKSLILKIIFLAAMVGAMLPAAASAQERLDTPGYDVVVLVDQSGSMGGSTVHPGINDKLDLRYEAPEYFFGLSGEHALYLSRDTGNAVINRIALVDFGSTVRRSLDWQIWNPKDLDQNRSMLETLIGVDGPLNKEARRPSLGDTNFPAAFEEVRRLFASLPADESGRVRVLILLTDGDPCIWNAEAQNCGNQAAQMAQVQESTNQFGGENLRVYVLAMNDANRNYWQQWSDDWTAIAGDGHARLLDSNDDAGQFFRDILEELRTLLPGGDKTRITRTSITPGSVTVPPYLDSIDFTLYKSKEDEQLQVKGPDGVAVTPGINPKVDESGEMIYSIRIFQPEPGIWEVGTTGSDPDNIDIDMTQVVAQGTLFSPPEVVVQYVPTRIEWELRDSLGDPLPKYANPIYALQPQVTVRSPVGVLPAVTLEQRDDGRFVATFVPVDTGLHTIEMRAEAQDIVGRKIKVFEGKIRDFTVSPVKLKASNPSAAPAQFAPVTLAFTLQTEQGMPVPDLGSSLAISALVQAGGQTYPLALRSAGGKYTGDFVPMSPGAHQVTAFTTITDPEGVAHAENQGVVSIFNVTPTRLQPVAQPIEATRFEEQALVYEFVDAANNRVAVADDIDVSARVISSGTAQDLSVQDSGDGQVAASFIPTVAGRHDIELTVVREGPGRRLAAGAPEIVGAIDVQEPKFTKTAPAQTSPQFKPMRIAYDVRNSEGGPWRLAPGYQLEFGGTLDDDGQTHTLHFQPEDDVSYATTMSPQETGDHAIKATAYVIAPDGSKIEVFSDASRPPMVNVKETTRVGLKLTQPEAGKTVSQYIDQLALAFNGLPFLGWFSEPAPMRIQVQLQDASGATVSPATVFESAGVPIVASVAKSDNSADFSDQFVLRETNQGVFTADASGLPTTGFVVKVGFSPGLTPTTAYDFEPTAMTAQGVVELGLNPFVIGARSLAGVLVVGLVLGSTFDFLRRRRLAQHPVRGTLMVVNEMGMPLDTRVISGRNRLVLKGFKATTHIKSMEVTCRNDSESRAGMVYVSGKLDNGMSFGGQLTPGVSRLPLGAFKIYLTKPV